MIVSLCERFHVLPSALLAEDTDLLRMLHIVERGREVDDVE